MFRWLQWIVWFVGRRVMALRYRVKLVGIQEVLQVPGPYLILPNHPAYCDPPNVLVRLWPYFKMRPMLILDHFAFTPLLDECPRVDRRRRQARRHGQAGILLVDLRHPLAKLGQLLFKAGHVWGFAFSLPV